MTPPLPPSPPPPSPPPPSPPPPSPPPSSPPPPSPPPPSPYASAADHPAEACEFCDIIGGGDALVYRDEVVAGFLDHRPLFPGHLLLVPVRHVVTLDQLPAEEVGPLFAVVTRAIAAMSTALGAQGAFMANNTIVSQSVFHLHVHVVPRTKGDGLRGFFWPRTGYDDDAHRDRTADALRSALS